MKMAMKLSDVLISALIKKGVLCEARNVDVEFPLPNNFNEVPHPPGTKIHLKVDHLTIKLEKEV